MNTVPASRSDSRILTIAVLGALGLFALWFIVHNAWRYTTYSLPVYTDYYWTRRAGLLPHILGGVVAVTTGLAQLWLGLTNRTAALHRLLGKVYAAAILVGSAGAFYMALTIPANLAVYATGLFILGVAWVVTTSMAIVAIRRRDIQQHRDWMIRSYTVTFAFVTFRLVDPLLSKYLHFSPDDADTVMAWSCWAIPLLLVEPLLQLRRMRRIA